MGTPLNVLMVEDSVDDVDLTLRALRRGGYEPLYERVDTPAAMRAALERQTWDIILADYVMPRFSGPAALKLVQEVGVDVPLIVVTGQVGEETAVEAMKAGASDYLLKGNLMRLVPAIQRELREAEVRRERRLSDEALRQAHTELERRVAERTQELSEERQRLRRVLDNMVDGVYVCDADGLITMANESGMRMLGFSNLGEAVHSLPDFPGLLQLRHLDGTQIVTEELPLFRALAGETIALDDEIAYNPRTRRDVFLRVSAAPIRDDNGKVVGAVALARDITDLTELDRLKDEFISVAAHELKTPITIMKGNAQALLRAAATIPPANRRTLEAIDRGADRIDRIVKDLLDISKILLGRLDVAKESIDLAELVEGIINRFALTATKHRIRMVAVEPVVVQADRDRLEQVIANLIDNAVKYSPHGGDVDVAVSVRDNEAVLSVRDDGIGIPAQKQRHIFERFYRAHTGTPFDYGGMGVGLFICNEIITRHGGRMWFESEEGKGSMFYVTLPIASSLN